MSTPLDDGFGGEGTWELCQPVHEVGVPLPISGQYPEAFSMVVNTQRNPFGTSSYSVTISRFNECSCSERKVPQ
jgi:hypothetical protein